jgi:hypothetical protein
MEDKVKCRYCKAWFDKEECDSYKDLYFIRYACKVCVKDNNQKYIKKKANSNQNKTSEEEPYREKTIRREGETNKEYEKRWNDENPLKLSTVECFLHNSSSFVNELEMDFNK